MAAHADLVRARVTSQTEAPKQRALADLSDSPMMPRTAISAEDRHGATQLGLVSERLTVLLGQQYMALHSDRPPSQHAADDDLGGGQKPIIDWRVPRDARGSKPGELSKYLSEQLSGISRKISSIRF